MTTTQLKEQLRHPYASEIWQTEILPHVFGREQVRWFPAAVELDVEAQYIDRVAAKRQLGVVQLGGENLFGEATRLAVVEVELLPGVTNIARNRVGLRGLTFGLIDGEQANGVLAFYHDPSQPNTYRFSFLMRQSSFDPISGEMVTTATHPKRYTYVLGKQESCTTAAKRLQGLALRKPTATLEHVQEAFSVEKLNKEFFTKYKEQYERFWGYLAANHRSVFLPGLAVPDKVEEKVKQEKPIRDFAKKLLGRLVFLHFLQRKGWLGCPMASSTWEGGDNSFLLALFEQFPNKEQFHSEALSELFFRTLNNPERENFRFQVGGMRQACRVPYLNGGLFDNDEPAAALLDFPKEFFSGLLEFFAQYNFTIDENRPDDHEVGIDPEMLGHIFENLLEENREKGAFYTPREIVQYMCQESLVEYLTKHLSLQGITRADVELLVREQKVTDGVHTYAGLTDKLLREVTICDPAIGSGAFPMGMLQEIFTARRYIYPHLNTSAAFDPVAVKKHIIQHTIHGVDLDKGAVDIARLRFWLALVVDEDHPQPLPNLDYKIMQGNSLLESFEGIALDHLQPGGRKKVLTDGHQIGLFQPLEDLQQQQQVALEHLLRDYFAIGDAPRKRQLRKQIEILVHEHLHYNVEIQLTQAQAILAEAETIPARIRLDVHDSLAQRLRKEKAHEKQQRVVEKCALAVTRLEGTKQRLDALQDSAERPYFLWHLYFHDVFERGGFDVVIGNPPYIRQESIGKIKDELKLAYPRTYKGTADTLVYFVELGYNLLREDGVFAYIISNKWMRAGYGTGMRKLLKSTRLHQVLDFRDLPVFEDADAYPCIVVFQKSEPQESVTALSFAHVPFKAPYHESLVKHIADKSYLLPLAQLDDEGWTLGDYHAQQLLLKLRKAGSPLKEYIGGESYYGIKPGSARFFVNEATRLTLIEQDARSAEIIMPMLRGRDVARYATPTHDQYMLFTRRGIDISNYPAVENYLSQFRDELLPNVSFPLKCANQN